MTAPSPGTPATSDEQRRVSPQELAMALAAYREYTAANPQMVDYAVAYAVAAVRPLIEAEARADERRRIGDRLRAIPRSRAVNDTEWDHVQVDAVEDAVWDR